MASIVTVGQAEVEPVASGSAYPLATVLRPGRNISMRATTRETVREVLAWILAGMGLGAMIWMVFQLGVRLGAL